MGEVIMSMHMHPF